MKHIGLRLVFLVGAVLTTACIAAGPRITTNTPVKEFSLPSFNEAGFRTMLIRGSEAVLTNANEASLRDMTLTLFSGEADAHVERVLLSPEAKVLIDKRIVFGTSTVRLVSDQLDLIGTEWRYEHESKRILITKHARVEFRAELKDILK